MTSLDVYSTRFSGCRNIYPVQIIRPLGKYRVDQQHYLDQFLTDTCINHCHIAAFVADSQKRSMAKGAKGHGAYYACEYCESKAQLLNIHDKALTRKKKDLHEEKKNISTQLSVARDNNDQNQIRILESALKNITESIKSINKKNNIIVWPASSLNGPKRTNEKVNEILEKIENGEILCSDEAKGIIKRSLFLDIPYFNYVLDIPCEYLHGVCLGVVKRMIILTFNVGETRQRNTTRRLSDISQFNRLISLIKFVREFSRRARSLDISVMKGQEYRNIIIIFFPVVIDCIEENAKERRLWLLLAYLIRACVLPDVEFQNIHASVITYCGKHFYELYEALFGARNCSYYTHIIGSHMPEMRVHGPLTLTSAFGFESFYAELRHAFTPGTISPLKQIMEKIFLKRSIAHHCCQSSIFFSHKETPLECNSFIYTFVDNNYHFFKIMSVDKDNLECCKVGKYPTIFPETPTLNWEKIGVFEAGGISEETIQINKKDVCGKVIKVNNLFITCPTNVLREK